MPRQKPSPTPRGNGSRGKAADARRTGQGAGSALEEMLRRQAQNPAPGERQSLAGGQERRPEAPRHLSAPKNR